MGKIKNTEGSAKSVGLLVVRLQYGLYVGHLSKWFVFAFMFKSWSVCRLWNGRPTIGYNGKVAEVPSFRISLWKDTLFEAFQQTVVVRSFNGFIQ